MIEQLPPLFPEERFLTIEQAEAALDQRDAVRGAIDLLTGAKFNPNHDEQGRFSESDSGGDTERGQWTDSPKPKWVVLPHPKDTPEQFAKRHLHAAIEHGAVFDGEGHKVIEREGMSAAEAMRTRLMAGAVEFTEDDAAYLKANPGTLVVHNHPASGMPVLSPEDIGFAATYKVSEMRVTSTKGTYSIKPPDAGWDSPSPMKAPADVREGGGPVLAKAGEPMSVQLAVRVSLAQNAGRYYVDHIRADSKADLTTRFVEHWRTLARETGVVFEEPGQPERVVIRIGTPVEVTR